MKDTLGMVTVAASNRAAEFEFLTNAKAHNGES
jgi:hypothetical protein